MFFDMGEIFKTCFRIKPGVNGSFVVIRGDEYGSTGEFIAFSNLEDLGNWFAKNVAACRQGGPSCSEKDAT